MQQPTDRRDCRLLALAATLAAACAGCSPSGPGGANANSTANDNSPPVDLITPVAIDLGAAGEVTLEPSSPQEQTLAVDVAGQLPAIPPVDATITIDPDDVSIALGTATDAGRTVTMNIFVGSNGLDDVCSHGVDVGPFSLAVDSNGATTVDPPSRDASDGAMAILRDGVFTACVRAASATAGSVDLDEFTIRYISPDLTEDTFTCAEIMALPMVQNALATLADADRVFVLSPGSTPADIQHDYTMFETTEFDPDGADTGNSITGVITFSGQTAGTVVRTGFGVSLTETIEGTSDEISLCALARSNNADCDQTIARLEALAVDGDGRELDGTFLAVVIERHAFSSGSCGDAGDFIHGSVSFTQLVTSFNVQRRGKVVLPERFEPDLLTLPSDGRPGVVTRLNRYEALRFDQGTPFATLALILPELATVCCFDGIALSRDNERFALTTDDPDVAIVFDADSNDVLRQSVADDFFLDPFVFDFSPNAQRIYVVSPHRDELDAVSIFQTGPGTGDPLVRRVPTPEALYPDLSRLSPDGRQLAVLLDSDAPEGYSRFLAFLDLETDQFGPAIDLDRPRLGPVRDTELVYSADGELVFMAGTSGVMVAETSPRDDGTFGLVQIDVSGGAFDPPVALALSNDGLVLAVAVQTVRGRTDFAVLDAYTLEVIHRADVEGIDPGEAWGIAHFGTGRAAIIANSRGRVVPVQTVAPFATGPPLNADDTESDAALGMIVAGGSVIAVANLDEPAIYLYELAP